MALSYANVVSSLSLIVAVGSGIYTGVVNWRNQENLSVTLMRDYSAGLEPSRPSMSVVGVEADMALKARFTGFISNTSNTTSVSVTNLEMVVTQFSGWGIVQVPTSSPQKAPSDTINGVETHSPIQLPFKLGPGEVMQFECHPIVSVAPAARERAERGLPAEQHGGFYSFGDHGKDIFDNDGENVPPAGFAVQKGTSIHQPQIKIRVSSGRGYSYEGLANWYANTYEMSGPRRLGDGVMPRRVFIPASKSRVETNPSN